MFGFGAFWMKHPPKIINWVYGYRTKMSMKNEETWEFAHSYHARVWFWGGIILLVVSLIIMVLLRESYVKVSIWIIYTQVAILLLSLIPTEVALRKRFGVKNNNIGK